MKWIDGKEIKDSVVLNDLESSWNVKFPREFTAIVSKHNDGTPELSLFDTDKTSERVFSSLLDFEEPSTYYVQKIYKSIEDVLPKSVFPFGIDPFGNVLCFDFSIGEGKPSIVFWNHEGELDEDGNEIHEIEFIADSFKEFIDSLYEIDDDLDDFDLSQLKSSW